MLFIDTRGRDRLSCNPVNHTDSPARNTVIAVIPARFNSTRLPGKPLLDICGRPMIVRVCERALAAANVSRVLVATDDERIRDAVRAAGYEALMTRAEHQSGSDRLAEVALALGESFDIIVNVQGDEPLISPRAIERAVAALLDDGEAACATTCETVASADDVLSPDVVKVVSDAHGHALYFSRSVIPYPREAVRRSGSLAAALAAEPALLSAFRKHTGLYVYRRAFLLEYARWPQSALERAESLEQLRILERGARIRVVETEERSIGVDTPADLERVRALFAAENLKER
ncbi:MAG TPA: 3-deoxy-manno-octulosonate cytidylyltransferase [Pyrinomonadaceae bacterium]|nr:3-deoxy-manno-octulosonate cytidylyltransferase [Pyrinomonadaceae bacterium]